MVFSPPLKRKKERKRETISLFSALVMRSRVFKLPGVDMILDVPPSLTKVDNDFSFFFVFFSFVFLSVRWFSLVSQRERYHS